MLPGTRVKLSEASHKRLVEYITRELEDAFPENKEIQEEIEENRKLYKAEPRAKKKTFPWYGAANLVIPVIGTSVDSITARVVNTMFGIEPFWTCKPLHKDFVPFAAPVQDFMDWSRKVEFPWYKEVRKHSVDVVQNGWAWMKYAWQVYTWRYYDGKKFYDVVVRRPFPQHVGAGDILTQCGVEDEEQAEWIGHRFRISDGDVRWRMQEDVWHISDREIEEIIIAKEKYREDGKEKLNQFYELYIRFPIAKITDPPDPIVVTWHHPTQTICRVIHNPLYYGEIPLKKSQFVQVNGESRGLGIAKQLRFMQEELTTIHCQQLDNATLANTRFFLGRRNVFKNDTQLWPGRFMTSPDPKNDLVAMQMGDVYQSMHVLESNVQAWAEKRSGISDYSLGRESSVLGDRATATGTLAILQEGNRRFDLNVRDLREVLGLGGQMILQLNQQYRPQGMAYFIQGEDGSMTEAMLNLPSEFVAMKLGIEVTASSATINRQVEQAGLVQLVGILTQHMQLGQQTAMLIGNPQAPAEMKEYTAKAFEGLSKLVVRVAQTFDQKNADDLVPQLQYMEAMADGMARQAIGGPQGASGPMGPGGGGPTMEDSMESEDGGDGTIPPG